MDCIAKVYIANFYIIDTFSFLFEWLKRSVYNGKCEISLLNEDHSFYDKYPCPDGIKESDMTRMIWTVYAAYVEVDCCNTEFLFDRIDTLKSSLDHMIKESNELNGTTTNSIDEKRIMNSKDILISDSNLAIGSYIISQDKNVQKDFKLESIESVDHARNYVAVFQNVEFSTLTDESLRTAAISYFSQPILTCYMNPSEIEQYNEIVKFNHDCVCAVTFSSIDCKPLSHKYQSLFTSFPLVPKDLLKQFSDCSTCKRFNNIGGANINEINNNNDNDDGVDDNGPANETNSSYDFDNDVAVFYSMIVAPFIPIMRCYNCQKAIEFYVSRKNMICKLNNLTQMSLPIVCKLEYDLKRICSIFEQYDWIANRKKAAILRKEQYESYNEKKRKSNDSSSLAIKKKKRKSNKIDNDNDKADNNITDDQLNQTNNEAKKSKEEITNDDQMDELSAIKFIVFGGPLTTESMASIVKFMKTLK